MGTNIVFEWQGLVFLIDPPEGCSAIG